MMLGWKRLSSGDRERMARGIEEGRAFGGPWHLEIHPTNRCNLGCFFCSARSHRHGEELPWEKLEEMLRRGASGDLRSVRLSGGGESLVYSRIGDLLGLLAETGLRIDDLTTNAVALGSLSDRVLAAGPDTVSVSLNEPDAVRYAGTMRVAPEMFDRAIKGVRAFNAGRRGLAADARPGLHVKFLVWRENFRLVDRMLDLAEDLEADTVQLNGMLGLDAGRRIGASSEGEAAEAREIIGRAVEREALRSPLRLTVSLGEEPALGAFALDAFYRALPPGADPMPGVVTDAERCEYCYMGWYSATVAADGTVYPCCNFVGDPSKAVGNVGRDSLEDIWRGAGFARMRREFRTLALLGGELEHSCRLQRFTEPVCIARRECPMAYYLCSADFYRDMAARLSATRHAPRRILAQSADGLVRLMHALRHDCR